MTREEAKYKNYTATKYGKSSLSVREDGVEIFHTGSRNEKYCGDLEKWLIDFVDNGLPGLRLLSVNLKSED